MNCLTDAERERIVSMYLGDDEGWKMAQEIAKGKGMLNL